ATPSGAARDGLQTASGRMYARGALAHTAPSDTRILNELRVLEAVLHGGYGRRGRFVPGHQSPRAWGYSFLEDTTPEHGSYSLFMNISARVSHKFNAFFASRPAKWVLQERARRLWVVCPYDEASTGSAQGVGQRHRYRGEKVVQRARGLRERARSMRQGAVITQVALEDPIGRCGVPLSHSSQRPYDWPMRIVDNDRQHDARRGLTPCVASSGGERPWIVGPP